MTKTNGREIPMGQMQQRKSKKESALIKERLEQQKLMKEQQQQQMMQQFQNLQHEVHNFATLEGPKYAFDLCVKKGNDAFAIKAVECADKLVQWVFQNKEGSLNEYVVRFRTVQACVHGTKQGIDGDLLACEALLKAYTDRSERLREEKNK